MHWFRSRKPAAAVLQGGLAQRAARRIDTAEVAQLARAPRVRISQLFNLEAAVRSKLFRWACALLLVVIAVAVLVGLLLLLHAAGAPVWTGEAAGWAQALLSTAAIGFALYTAQGAQRHTEDLRREDLEQRRRGVLAIAHAAFDKIRSIDLDASQGRLHFFFDETFDRGYFEHTLAALRAVPLHELLSYNMTVGVLAMIEVLMRVERFCEAHAEGERNGVSFEEGYFATNAETLTDAIHALNFIQGGVTGLSTEEIERQNGAGGPQDF